MRKFLAYPVDSGKTPWTVVELDDHPKPTPYQIKLVAARQLRRDGHDFEADDLDFHSVLS